jgi:hypothetical protein
MVGRSFSLCLVAVGDDNSSLVLVAVACLAGVLGTVGVVWFRTRKTTSQERTPEPKRNSDKKKTNVRSATPTDRRRQGNQGTIFEPPVTPLPPRLDWIDSLEPTPDDVPFLIDTLRNRYFRDMRRQRAAELLGQLGPDAIAARQTLLWECVDDSQSGVVRYWALDALRKIDHDAVGMVLNQAYHDTDHQVRKLAYIISETYPSVDEGMIATIAKAASNETDSLIRMVAMRTVFARAEPATARGVAERAVNDVDGQVRHLANQFMTQ